MNMKLIGLGAVAVVGAGYCSQAIVSWGMKQTETTKKMYKKNKVWIERITFFVASAATFCLAVHQYKMMSQLTNQYKNVNQTVLTQLQTQFIDQNKDITATLDMAAQTFDLKSLVEEWMGRLGKIKFMETLDRCGIINLISGPPLMDPKKRYSRIDDFALVSKYHLIPGVKEMFQALGLPTKLHTGSWPE